MIALLAALVVQGEPTLSPMQALKEAERLGGQGRLLAQAQTLQRAFDHGTKTERRLLGWSLSISLGALGDEAGAQRAFEAARAPGAIPKLEPEIAQEMEASRREEGVAAIVRAARDRQIVMINEAHHVQRHRAFSLLVARALRRIGFDTFAAEAFAPDAPRLLKGGAPTAEAGEFLRDPFFGDLARQVVKIGYRPVAYEIEKAPEGDDIYAVVNSRDQMEAENLVARVLKENPKARILIHCGFSHVTKTWDRVKDGRELAWLAARLKRLTGIDPLTVDQVGGTEGSDLDHSSPEYRFAVEKGWLNRPLAFRRPQGDYGAYGPWRGKVDLQVFHPPTRMVHGRPDWTAMGGYRSPRPVDPKLVPTQGSVLLQAFLASEPADAIPMDQVVLRAGTEAPALMLPRGKFRLVTQPK